MLKHVKAIGWFVKEYGIAQVSMNLTNIEQTPLHVAFDACMESAIERGLRVTGSEIVGMVPKKCLTDAGRYFLRKQKWSEGASEEELIDIAVKSMGLSELKPFDPKEKVIELKIEGESKSLAKMNLREFCNETLSDSPAPGGGSVAALMGALGASLGGMVANLSAGKRGWDDKLQYFSDWAVKAQKLKDELLALVDEDANAFNKVMDAFGLAKGSAEEKTAREKAVESATKYAAEIPLKVMATAAKSYELLAEMAEKGNPASGSDVGVGAGATRAGIDGAALNVRINLAQLKDQKFKAELSRRVDKLKADSESKIEKKSKSAEVVDLGGRVALPGFVDAHTHLVFAGNRLDDFERRARGETYEQIAKAGGGIWSTVEKTRDASEDQLFAAAKKRINWFLKCGTTTIEAKSGY